MRHLNTLLFLCSLFCRHACTGQVQDSLLTLPEAVNLALLKSPRLAVAATAITAAEYRQKGAGVISNPELRISDVSTRYYDGDMSGLFEEMRIGLRWKPPEPGELAEKQTEKAVQVWENRVDAWHERCHLVTEVRDCYTDIIAYSRLAELARCRSLLARRRSGIIDGLAAIGEKSTIDQVEAKMKLAECENTYARLKGKRKTARQNLIALTGLDSLARLQSDSLVTSLPPLSHLIDTALVRRPEMALARQRVEHARKKIMFEKLKILPWLNFIDLSRHRDQNHKKDWNEVRLGLRLPLFTWNRDDIRASNAALLQSEHIIQATLDEIAAEIRKAHEQWLECRLDWEKTVESITDIKNLARGMTTDSTASGDSPDKILDLEVSLTGFEMEVIQKERALRHAFSDLLSALGLTTPLSNFHGEN